MKRWCGHADGIESNCEHVVVVMPDGAKVLFVRLSVICRVCTVVYNFSGPTSPEPSPDHPTIFPQRNLLAAPLEMEE